MRRTTIRTTEWFWQKFTIIASIIAFVVDAATLISWSQGNFAPPILIGTLPVVNIDIPSESITLIFLLYTLIAFAIFAWRISRKFIYISGATIPLFFVWASVFKQIDDYVAVFWILIWADIYFGILLVDSSIFRMRSWKKIKDTTWLGKTKINFLFALITPGLILAPIAVLWLHDAYGLQWKDAIPLGFLLGQAGWLIVFCIGLGICAAYIGVWLLRQHFNKTT